MSIATMVHVYFGPLNFLLFRTDTLKSNPDKLKIGRRSFMEVYPSVNDIFSNVIIKLKLDDVSGCFTFLY